MTLLEIVGPELAMAVIGAVVGLIAGQLAVYIGERL